MGLDISRAQAAVMAVTVAVWTLDRFASRGRAPRGLPFVVLALFAVEAALLFLQPSPTTSPAQPFVLGALMVIVCEEMLWRRRTTRQARELEQLGRTIRDGNPIDPRSPGWTLPGKQAPPGKPEPLRCAHCGRELALGELADPWACADATIASARGGGGQLGHADPRPIARFQDLGRALIDPGPLDTIELAAAACPAQLAKDDPHCPYAGGACPRHRGPSSLLHAAAGAGGGQLGHGPGDDAGTLIVGYAAPTSREPTVTASCPKCDKTVFVPARFAKGLFGLTFTFPLLIDCHECSGRTIERLARRTEPLACVECGKEIPVGHPPITIVPAPSTRIAQRIGASTTVWVCSQECASRALTAAEGKS